MRTRGGQRQDRLARTARECARKSPLSAIRPPSSGAKICISETNLPPGAAPGPERLPEITRPFPTVSEASQPNSPVHVAAQPRFALIATAVFGSACLVAALLMQHIGGYDPCALCVEQRMAYLAGAFISAGALTLSRSSRGLIGSVVAAAAAYTWGVVTAARQVYLQAFPPKTASCVLPRSLADDLGLADLLPQLFAAGGDCLDGSAKFLGLTLPQASLAAFCLMLGYLAWVLVRQRRAATAATIRG